MNANEIKWIASNSLDLNPFYFSIPEKLDSFGYCIDFSGYGEGKADKAQLCIFDTANKKENPNILIICPAGCKESWYNCLLKGLGLDFKFVNGAHNSIQFFSAEMANLLIMDEEVLKEAGSSSFAEIKNSGLLWDLVIIDAAGSLDGIEPEVYTDNLGMKTEKLLVFAPYPAEYTEAPDKIKTIVKTLLNESSMAEGIDSYPIDEKVMQFTMNTPYADYPAGNAGDNKVTTVKYAFDEKDIPQKLHIEEMQSGSRYSHGGNIFEEYNLEERKIYLKPSYTRSEAEILRAKDKKLDKFLGIIDEVMNSEDKTAIVYFSSEATVSYIEKILNSVYYDKTSSVAVFDKSRFDTRKLKNWYETEKGQRIRVLLANDNLSETCGVYSPITHIINYELPDNPVILQQRYMRRGLMGGKNPEFIIFADENGVFDSRILKKALAGNIYKAFRRNVPSENILLYVEGIEQILSDMLFDIKYIADYTGAVGSSFDVISRFKQEYNVPAGRNLTTAARTHEYSQRKLEVLSAALGVTELMAEKDINKEALLEKVKAKVEQLRSGYSYFNDKNGLETIPKNSAHTDEFKQFASYLDGNPFKLGLNESRKALEKAVSGKKNFVYIKDALKEVSDTLKPAVLYNIWTYWHKTLGIGGSYGEFIKAYNEGVI